MSKLWISYAWSDNETGDVDFVCQELAEAGIEVKIDRTVLGAGKRLWDQIERFITNPAECDAWAFYATQTSIAREPCREELAYALGRALQSRSDFPLVGITPSSAAISLFPASLSSRLCVSLEDRDWKERVVAAVEKRSPHVVLPSVLPYHVKIYRTSACYVIEVRPRAGVWYPFFCGVLVEEKDRLEPTLNHGPSGAVPSGSMARPLADEISDDGRWHLLWRADQVTPTNSMFLWCKVPPSRIFFGPKNGQKHIVELEIVEG
jgi:hypothetical protein